MRHLTSAQNGSIEHRLLQSETLSEERVTKTYKDY